MNVSTKKELTVKIKNKFNETYSLEGFQKQDLNVFFYLLCIFKNSKTTKKTIQIRDIMNACNIHHSDMSLAEFKLKLQQQIFMHIQKISLLVVDDSGERNIMIFPEVFFSSDKPEITVEIQQSFLEYISSFDEAQYTEFALSEIIKLKSIYSKNLYRLLSQFDHTGWYKNMNLETFKKLLGCPSTYDTRKFNERCFIPAISELAGSPDKTGRATSDVYFYFVNIEYLFIDPNTITDPDAKQKHIEKAKEIKDKIYIKDKNSPGQKQVGVELRFKPRKQKNTKKEKEIKSEAKIENTYISVNLSTTKAEKITGIKETKSILKETLPESMNDHTERAKITFLNDPVKLYMDEEEPPFE